MLPMLEDLAQDLSGKAEIVKFNCNARNKDLGKELNIKVAPTFHVYKNSNKVGFQYVALLEEVLIKLARSVRISIIIFVLSCHTMWTFNPSLNV